MQHITDSFTPDIKPVPADFPAAPALGRMTMKKQFHGGIEATSVGQMLTSMSATKGSAGYVAVELVNGVLDGHTGTFSLIHLGLMDRGSPRSTAPSFPIQEPGISLASPEASLSMSLRTVSTPTTSTTCSPPTPECRVANKLRIPRLDS